MRAGAPCFDAPYVDVDEWRDAPVRHRYVHGGFGGTDTRFSVYFAPDDVYAGRFLQWLEGGPGGHEHEAAPLLAFSFAQGAYVVESNQGHLGVDPGPPDPTVTAYRASEASACYARELATAMYDSVPHHGYLWGGSGGGFRTIIGLERVDDVWDGGVPFVCPFDGRMTGKYTGKMILVNNTLDPLVPIAAGISYADLVGEQLGAAARGAFRLWWTDNAGHTLPEDDFPRLEKPLINFMGILEQAVVDLIDWVEDEREPPLSTSYEVRDDNLCLPASAAGRRGIQPVVSATANGSRRADVKAGEPVELRFTAAAPPDAGTIIGAEWNFDDTEAHSWKQAGIDGSAARVELSTEHVFDRPGTYVPIVRVRSQRIGTIDGPFGRLENLADVRVVVT